MWLFWCAKLRTYEWILWRGLLVLQYYSGSRWWLNRSTKLSPCGWYAVVYITSISQMHQGSALAQCSWSSVCAKSAHGSKQVNECLYRMRKVVYSNRLQHWFQRVQWLKLSYHHRPLHWQVKHFIEENNKVKRIYIIPTKLLNPHKADDHHGFTGIKLEDKLQIETGIFVDYGHFHCVMIIVYLMILVFGSYYIQHMIVLVKWISWHSLPVAIIDNTERRKPINCDVCY